MFSSAPIALNLQHVQHRIAQAAARCATSRGIHPPAGGLKFFDAEAVAAASDAGQHAFGENYVQEGVAKIEALRARGWSGTASVRCRVARPRWWPPTSTGSRVWTARSWPSA